MRDVWNIVKKGYTGSDDPTYPNEKKLYEYDAKARNALMNGLSDAELVKVMSCTSAKEIWDKLQGVYEGDKKIKEAKLQTYRTQFENIKMTENENVGAYLQRVNEVVTSIRGLGETLKDQVVVKKVLRSLPSRFNSKVSAPFHITYLHQELKIKHHTDTRFFTWFTQIGYVHGALSTSTLNL